MTTPHSILERNVDSIFTMQLPDDFPTHLLNPHIAHYMVRYHLLPSRIMGETELALEEVSKYIKPNILPAPFHENDGAITAIRVFHNKVCAALDDCFHHIWMVPNVEWELRYVNFTVDRSGLVVVMKRKRL